MTKVDFKKTLESYKAKHAKFAIMDIPKLQYLMIDGYGDPNTSKEFSDAVAALYPIAYKLKFKSKIELEKDFVVMPLEGLWWSNDMSVFTSARDKSQWNWTLMIMQPDWITQEFFAKTLAEVKSDISPSLGRVRLESLEEGVCVQTLHIGSYDDETELLATMHDQFIPSNGFQMTKKHHEIYLSDARKVEPHKLRTILRQPVISTKE